MTNLVVTSEITGKVVKPGDIVESFRGEKARLIEATRPSEIGRTGKVYVEWIENGYKQEYYDSVFDLTVN